MNTVQKKTGLIAACLLAVCFAGDLRGEDLTGWWSGRWESCKTGHQGPLKGYFCKIDETRYQVTFSGRFFKILPFRYKTILNVIEDGDRVKLSGESRLGPIMGTFTYSAEATASEFISRYTSRKDCGYFSMQRCCE